MRMSGSNGTTCLDDLILKVIKEVLIDVFGEKAFRVMINFFEKSYRAKWEEIPKRTYLFEDFLHKVLGEGSTILEELILQNIYSTLRMSFKRKKGYTFSRYIEDLRMRWKM